MIELSGAHIRCEDQGAGPCTVLVHGLGGDIYSWDRLWPLLSEDRRLLRYDLRDFGLSTAKSDASFTHVGDLAELLDTRSVDCCDLIGVSMGGSIALGFALDHPDKVRTLALISPQIAGWEWSEAWRERWQSLTVAAREGRMDEAKRLWWQHPMFDSTRATAAAEDLRQEIDRFAGRQWICDNHALVLPDIERLHELRSPTLLLTGERDLEDFRLMADIIEASSDSVQRMDVSGRGHLLHVEAPELCAQHIAAFLHVHSPI